MNATLCRCMTYYRVQAAIKRAAAAMAGGAAAAGKVGLRAENSEPALTRQGGVA